MFDIRCASLLRLAFAFCSAYEAFQNLCFPSVSISLTVSLSFVETKLGGETVS